jgi:hypothetical protein
VCVLVSAAVVAAFAPTLFLDEQLHPPATDPDPLAPHRHFGASLATAWPSDSARAPQAHRVFILRECYTLTQNAKGKILVNTSELTSLNRTVRLL